MLYLPDAAACQVKAWYALPKTARCQHHYATAAGFARAGSRKRPGHCDEHSAGQLRSQRSRADLLTELEDAGGAFASATEQTKLPQLFVAIRGKALGRT